MFENRSRRRRLVRASACALAVAVASVASVATAARAQSVEVVAPGSASRSAASPSLVYHATIERDGEDAAGFTRYHLTWSSGDDRGRADISSDVRTVTSFFVLDDGRAVLVGGTRTPRVSAFHAIALESAKTVVVSECYAPSVSPDGRFIAYVRIHPQRRAAAGRASVARMSAEYRVMDLAAGDSAQPPSYPVPLQQTANGHTHVLAMPIVWDAGDRFRFGDRFEGHVNRLRVAVDDAGKPSIESAVAAP